VNAPVIDTVTRVVLSAEGAQRLQMAWLQGNNTPCHKNKRKYVFTNILTTVRLYSLGMNDVSYIRWLLTEEAFVQEKKVLQQV